MIPKRTLGKTGEQLSIVGFGGIMVRDTVPSEADILVSQAVERGVNYFDVAPSYGNAEECLGPALVPYRANVFLACKTGKRKAKEAQVELENSLRRLHTDHFDLYQLHGMTTEEDFEQVTGPGGALEAFVTAREKGLVRYLGFSAHSVDIALRLLGTFEFNSILFPVNWVNYFNGDFGPQVVAEAASRGLGVLALKAMARQRLAPGATRRYNKCWYEPTDNKQEAQLALRFTLSQEITAAIPPGDQSFYPWALDVAEDFKPITDVEVDELRASATDLTPIFRHTS